MGRFIVLAGFALVGIGVLVIVLERLHIQPGRLPGDLVLRSKSATFYFPVVTCLVLSALASLLMWLLNRR